MKTRTDARNHGPRLWVPRRLLALAVGAIIAAAPGALCAQQFGTDDAGVVKFGACQIEAWHGETETRVEPACQLIRNLEVMVGFALDGVGGGIEEYSLELKTVLRAPEPGGLGVGLVGGLDVAREWEPEDGPLAGAFVYVPATLSFGDDRFLLHGNLGWQFSRDDDRHSLLWGARGDLHLPWLDERFVVVGELFGDDSERPEFQAGLRTKIVPDRLILDVSWGGHTVRQREGRGWVVGFGWTPPPFL